MKPRDPHYDSSSHDELLWNERYDAVSEFVQGQLAALTTEEACQLLQDWIICFHKKEYST